MLQDLRAGRFHLVGRHGTHRPLRTDDHEGRGLNRAMRRRKDAGTRGAARGLKRVAEGGGHGGGT